MARKKDKQAQKDKRAEKDNASRPAARTPAAEVVERRPAAPDESAAAGR